MSILEKTDLTTQLLLPAVNNPPIPTLSIAFFSAVSFPLAFPPTVARGFGWPSVGLGVEGVNARVGTWLLKLLSSDGTQSASEKTSITEPRIRGWAFFDFFQDPEDNSVVPLLVECNYQGRVMGDEGWQ